MCYCPGLSVVQPFFRIERHPAVSVGVRAVECNGWSLHVATGLGVLVFGLLVSNTASVAVLAAFLLLSILLLCALIGLLR